MLSGWLAGRRLPAWPASFVFVTCSLARPLLLSRIVVLLRIGSNCSPKIEWKFGVFISEICCQSVREECANRDYVG